MHSFVPDEIFLNQISSVLEARYKPDSVSAYLDLLTGLLIFVCGISKTRTDFVQ